MRKPSQQEYRHFRKILLTRGHNHGHITNLQRNIELVLAVIASNNLYKENCFVRKSFEICNEVEGYNCGECGCLAILDNYAI